MYKNCCPVVLITYNRPEHTARVLKSLEQHGVRDLFIYSDAPRTEVDRERVEQTRALLHSITWTYPTIIERSSNFGLARSILSAADEVFAAYDRLILLEDDCVPGPHFFQFMERALDCYQADPRVFGVSGYSVSIPEAVRNHYPFDLYFSPRIGSWGWGTWKRAWNVMERDMVRVTQRCLDAGIDLCQGGTDIPQVVQGVLSGNVRDTWTLPWVLSVYLQRGFFAYPTVSHVSNIGMDGSGVHCGVTDKYHTAIAQVPPSRIPERVVLDEAVYRVFRSYYDMAPSADILPEFRRLTENLDVRTSSCSQQQGMQETTSPTMNQTMECMKTESQSHYSQEYWTYQRPIGEAGGVLNRFKFEPYIKPTDVVLDFGCGGGFLLRNIECAKRLGVEISPFARSNAEQLGISVFTSLDAIPNASIDVVISNHALEHVESPHAIFTAFRDKLKIGGRMVVVVPCEQPHEANFNYREDDVNQHLYTWCPMSLGNLVARAGLKIVVAEAFQHQWTPDFLTAYKSESLESYHARCREFARSNRNYQVRVVAQRVA